MLYLVDTPLATEAFRTARDDPDPHVVLIQDGVLLRIGEDIPEIDASYYAIERDVEIRGAPLADFVDVITYADLVELMNDYDVRSFA